MAHVEGVQPPGAQSNSTMSPIAVPVLRDSEERIFIFRYIYISLFRGEDTTMTKTVKSSSRKALKGKGSKITILAGLVLLCYVAMQLFNNRRTPLPTLFVSWSAASPQSSIITTATSSLSSSFSLAYQQSYGFFDDITDEDWKMRQAMARSHDHHENSSDPLLYWSKKDPPGMYYYYHYEPLFSCPHSYRLGGAGDGPKWTCDAHRLKKVAQRRKVKCLIYSIGCSGVYLWEDALYQLLGPNVCEFHIFDPGNYDRPVVNAQRDMYYHKWGIKSTYHKETRSIVEDGANGTFYTFPETMRLLGHENRTMDILKVDCEYCEWFSFRDWIQYGNNVRQLMIETHQLPMPWFGKRNWPWGTLLDLKPNQFFDELQNAGFIMFSKEPNTHWFSKVKGSSIINFVPHDVCMFCVCQTGTQFTISPLFVM